MKKEESSSKDVAEEEESATTTKIPKLSPAQVTQKILLEDLKSRLKKLNPRCAGKPHSSSIFITF